CFSGMNGPSNRAVSGTSSKVKETMGTVVATLSGRLPKRQIRRFDTRSTRLASFRAISGMRCRLHSRPLRGFGYECGPRLQAQAAQRRHQREPDEAAALEEQALQAGIEQREQPDA